MKALKCRIWINKILKPKRNITKKNRINWIKSNGKIYIIKKEYIYNKKKLSNSQKKNKKFKRNKSTIIWKGPK